MKALIIAGITLLFVALGFVTLQWMKTRTSLEGLQRRLDSQPVRIEVSVDSGGTIAGLESQLPPIPRTQVPSRNPMEILRQQQQERLQQDYLGELRRANDIEDRRLQNEEREQFRKQLQSRRY